MTEQLKAEAYVRSQRPALYKPEYSVCSAHMVALDKGCDTCQTGWLSPNLQDWLAVLGSYNRAARIKNHQWGIEVTDDAVIIGDYKIILNLTTGQPATEADYKAFNEIVGA